TPRLAESEVVTILPVVVKVISKVLLLPRPAREPRVTLIADAPFCVTRKAEEVVALVVNWENAWLLAAPLVPTMFSVPPPSAKAVFADPLLRILVPVTPAE